MRIVLPTAFTGIVTGIVLGIARVAGETAPLLILVGYSPNTNGNLFNGFQGSLPGMINDQFVNLGNSARTTWTRTARSPPSQLRRRPDVGRGAHADHHRHGAEPDRPADRAGQQDPTRTREEHDSMAKRIDAKNLNIYYGKFLAVSECQLRPSRRAR